MRRIVFGLTLVLVMAGCRTPAYCGGEFRHRDPDVVAKGPVESFGKHSRWIFFWGLLGTEKIDLPETGGGFNIKDELAGKFADNEQIVDLTFEEGTTLPGVITGIFTIGIVSEREIVVKGRRADLTPPPPPPTDGSGAGVPPASRPTH